ncbi:MAG: terminase small subunit [Candidatus Tenebribacter burtonii]|jgi:hypothetical protein|nr:terminase small subunit [Candidatus Tenebribacter burtonii]
MPTKKNIRTPEILYELFNKYKTYCKANPKKKNQFNSKLGKEVSISREVPLTWNGFEIWLRNNKVIVRLDDYKSNKEGRYTEYADIIHDINTEIYEDKFTGAVVGIYQHNIIARDLCLKDRKDLTSNDKKMEATRIKIDSLIKEIVDE